MAAKIKNDRKIRISVALKPDDLAKLEAMAREQERSVSWIASHTIHSYLATITIPPLADTTGEETDSATDL